VFDMNRAGKIAVVIALVFAIFAVIVIKQKDKSSGPLEEAAVAKSDTTSEQDSNNIAAIKTEDKQVAVLPRLVDLGADKCVPCKMMAPILEELKSEYTNTFKVDFYDVWKEPDIAKKFAIRVIPTQVFLDSSGKEMFRHEGFFAKEDILAKWKELGIDIEKGRKQ